MVNLMIKISFQNLIFESFLVSFKNNFIYLNKRKNDINNKLVIGFYLYIL
jgi:hypothetical protein